MTFKAIRDLLFLLPPEVSHHVSMHAINLLGHTNLSPLMARPMVSDPVDVMGISFPNRVGLAAGLDKDAAYIDGLGKLGFGFLEVGTVTPLAQSGNDKPRMFRLTPERAIINRMGFNNEGVDALVRKVRRSNFDGVIGINIGKNKLTPSEDALSDYVACLKKVYRLASYITINISSPNTKDLRSLQFGEELANLLEGIKQTHATLKEQYEHHVPIVVKIAPDMEEEELRGVCRELLKFDIDGVIVSNTTVDRTSISGSLHCSETGGLSGAPLFERSNRALELVVSELKGKMAIIGVGGIMSGADAAEKIRLGADLIQLYTGFIYSGPDLVEASALAIASANTKS